MEVTVKENEAKLMGVKNIGESNKSFHQLF